MKNRPLFVSVIFCILCIFLMYRSNSSGEIRKTSNKNGISALLLAPNHLGANYFLYKDIIEGYGWKVTHTAVVNPVPPCGFWGQHEGAPSLIPDMMVSEIEDISVYDCLILPPSPGNAWKVPDSYKDILDSREALDLITRFVKSGKPVFTTCSGSRVLAKAGVIKGKKIVGSPRFRNEYEQAGAIYAGNDRNDTPPLITENIITSARGQTYSHANAQAMATLIENGQKRGKKDKVNANYIKTADNIISEKTTVWSKIYGGPDSDGGKALCETKDGCYLITGYTFAPGSRDADILVIKTDENGKIKWKKIFGGAGTEYGNGCTSISDGYLVTGYTTSFGSGSKDVYLIKLDLNGKIVWEKTYGGESWDVGMSVCETKNGNYLVCGYTHSYGAGEEDVYLLKIDKDGSEIWSKTYGGKRIDWGNSVSVTEDNEIIIGGTSLSYGGKNSNFYVIKTDAEGRELWHGSYEGKGNAGHQFDWCKASFLTKDGGVVVTGYADCNDLMDAVIIKVDSNGKEQWQLSFGNNPYYDYGNTVIQTSDGGYIAGGITKSMVKESVKGKKIYNNDFYLVKINKAGKIEWEKVFGDTDSDWITSVIENKDGDLICTGFTETGEKGEFDVCLFKIKIQ